MDAIHKIVAWVLSPLGIFFIGTALGLGLRARVPALRRLGGWVAALAAVQLWLMSCSVTTRLVGLPLEGEETDAIGLPPAEAIVLLGGGMGRHERCGRAELFQGADRVWLAARLMKAGKAPLLTVSGNGAPAEIAFLHDIGVETNAVISLASARNTEEEAALIARAIGEREGRKRQGKPRILLVTSAWHLPRAKMLFARAGFEVIGAPTDYEMHYVAENPLTVRDFFPAVDALERNSYAVKEWIARACYAIKR